jgi:tetratricopeptide (TPR) repeat protein
VRQQSIGRYRILGELARGGYGAVYRAFDPQLEREVALKLMLGHRSRDATARKRFQREAKALAQLDHPNLVSVFDTGERGDLPFLAMEFVEGEALYQRLDRDGPLFPALAAEAALALAGGLEHAHSKGFLHRDVKPSNVLFDRTGEPRLTDFGLVHEMGADVTRLSQTGQFLGTPGYCAPEQAMGQLDRIGPPTDVFGLGATLYAMLTGIPPFEATVIGSVVAAEKPAKPPSTHQPGVDPRLDAICLRCLASKPEDRYPSASALADDLRRYLAGDAAPAPATRNPVPAVAAVILALGAGTAGWLALTPRPAPTSAAQSPPPASTGAPTHDPPTPAPTPETSAPTAETPAATPSPEPSPDPSSELRSLLERGDAEQQRRNYRAAFDAFDQALALDPDNGAALRGRSCARMSMDDRERALADANRAIEVDPGHPHSWLLRADIYASEARHEEAERDYAMALERDPTDAIAWQRWGLNSGLLGLHSEAIDHFSRAIELQPDHAAHWSSRAVARKNARDLDGALADMQKAVELAPDQPRLWKDLAVTHKERQEPRESEAAASRAILLQPNYPEALNVRASARRKLGNLPGALADVEATLRLAPPESAEYKWAGAMRNMLQGGSQPNH